MSFGPGNNCYIKKIRKHSSQQVHKWTPGYYIYSNLKQPSILLLNAFVQDSSSLLHCNKLPQVWYLNSTNIFIYSSGTQKLKICLLDKTQPDCRWCWFPPQVAWEQLLSCLVQFLEVSLTSGLLPESLLPTVSVIESPIPPDLPVSNDYTGNLQIIQGNFPSSISSPK